MGAKTQCDICGETLKTFKKHKTADGIVCASCLIKAGFPASETTASLDEITKRQKMTKEEREQYIKELIAARGEWQPAHPVTPVDNTPQCPKCRSTSISADKKGFGVGKAVVGAAVAGPLGLVAGNLGAKKVRITCLNCGYQWMAGKG